MRALAKTVHGGSSPEVWDAVTSETLHLLGTVPMHRRTQMTANRRPTGTANEIFVPAQKASWLAGCLLGLAACLGWLLGWLVAWIGCLVGWLAARAGCLTGWRAGLGWLAGWLHRLGQPS